MVSPPTTALPRVILLNIFLLFKRGRGFLVPLPAQLN